MGKNKYRYNFEIEVAELGYSDSDENGWTNAEFIEVYGNTLDELFENAIVHYSNQDGGEAGMQGADETWMQDLIEEEYWRLYTKEVMGNVGT